MPGLTLTGEDTFAEPPTGAREDRFARAVRRAVRQAGEARRGYVALWRKAVLVACWFVASYVALLASGGMPATILASLSLGLAAGALAFNVFHDANHGAFCRDRRLNLLVARCCCTALGAARLLWVRKHVIHHSYPNVFEWDEDLEMRGALRISPEQEWRPPHRGQHLYFPLLYAVSAIEWIFVKDFVQYFRLRLGYHRIPPLTPSEHVEFWLCKAVYGAAWLVAPLCLLPLTAAAAAFVIYHVVFGFVLALATQVAHINTATEFPPMGGTPRADDWAAHQLRTTTNFATRNPLANWYLGGLNFQIEHHLFPHLPHTTYPAIGVTVREVAQQFGVRYNEFPTLRETFAAHVRHLRRLGLGGEGAEVSAGSSADGKVEGAR